MIYLIASSYQSAWGWCIDEGVDSSDRTKVEIITNLDQAHGKRPRPSDRIVLVRGMHSADQRQAHLYLAHQQEQACMRRDISLRQAP